MNTQGNAHEIVHHEPHSTPSRIIAIAVDQSKFSRFALDWAVNNFINPTTDQVNLLNVRQSSIPPVILIDPIMQVGDENLQDEAIEKKKSHDLIISYAKMLVEKGIKVTGYALKGEVKDEIVYKCDELKADVLIIGSRGMGIFKRMVLGSVSDFCVHNCHCTVLVPKEN